MRVIRERLLIVLSAVLLLQCAGVIAPLVLSATGVDVAEMCTCPGGVHGTTCPMHHSKETETQDSAHRCALKNAATPSHAALLTFMSGAGVPPSIVRLDIAEQVFDVPKNAESNVLPTPDFPDSPPPRR